MKDRWNKHIRRAKLKKMKEIILQLEGMGLLPKGATMKDLNELLKRLDSLIEVKKKRLNLGDNNG